MNAVNFGAASPLRVLVLALYAISAEETSA